MRLDIFTAAAPSVLSGCTITVSGLPSGSAAGTASFFAFHGQSTTTPFDTNASLPTLSRNAGPNQPSATYSTSFPNDTIIWVGAVLEGNSIAGLLPTGFTALPGNGTVSSNGNSCSSSCYNGVALGYLQVSSKQSGVTTYAPGTLLNWNVSVTALTDGTGGPSGNSPPLVMFPQ
jgi:hypothetical protein